MALPVAYALISADGLSVENIVRADADYVALLTGKGRLLRPLGPMDVVSPGDMYDKLTDRFTRVAPSIVDRITIGTTVYEPQPSVSEPGKFVLVKVG